MLAQGISNAFEEDRAMIMAQQDVLNRSPDRTMFNIGADAAPMQVRARLEQLLATEAAGRS